MAGGRVLKGFEGLDIGDRMRVELVNTDKPWIYRLRALRIGLDVGGFARMSSARSWLLTEAMKC
jgi:hypothetical protein